MDYAKESLRLHSEWRGKLEVTPRAQVDSKEALSLAYTPGVAQPCLEIQKHPEKSYELTRRHNQVAVITAGTAVRETMPILKACADVQVPHMFISVDRCEVGHTPGKTAIMEVEEEFGVKVHPIVTVVDIHEYLKEHGTDPELLKAMEGYMEQYCVL